MNIFIKVTIVLLYLFCCSVLLQSQTRTYSIGSMTIIDSGYSAKWSNRGLISSSMAMDTMIVNQQRLMLKDFMFTPDSMKYVSKKYMGDKVKNTFTTIQGAIDSSGEGCLIWVYPGTYNESIRLKNNVNLYLNDAVIYLPNVTNDTLSVVSDIGGAVTCAILGTGTIRRGTSNGAFPENHINCLAVFNNSNITIELKELFNENNLSYSNWGYYDVAIGMYAQGTVKGYIGALKVANTGFSDESRSLYQTQGVIDLTIDTIYSPTTAISTIETKGRNAELHLRLNKQISKCDWLCNDSARQFINCRSIYASYINIYATRRGNQTINIDEDMVHNTVTGTFLTCDSNAWQTVKVRNIRSVNGRIFCGANGNQYVYANNITQSSTSLNILSAVPVQNFFGSQHIFANDSISSYYTTIYTNSWFTYPQSEYSANIICSLNDTGHAVLNDFGIMQLTANKIFTNGYAAVVCNGGNNLINVRDSLMSRKNNPIAHGTGDSCNALWAEFGAILDVKVGVMTSDSLCYAMIIADSSRGEIYADEISSKYGSAIKLSGTRKVTIRNATISSRNGINSSGYFVGTILTNSDSLYLQNCNIITNTSGASYSISPIGSATKFNIYGILQINKGVNGMCSDNGVLIKDNTILTGICASDKVTSETSGFTELGELSPSIKLAIVKGVFPSTNTTATYTHGLTNGKIISMTAWCRDDTTTATGNDIHYEPNTTGIADVQFVATFDSLKCKVSLISASKLFNDSVFFYLTYIK